MVIILKKGLVLEGGAMRGMFTAGVLDVMMENDIEIDGIIGVSAGAAFGCNYKSGQIGRAVRYNMRFCRDKRYCGWYSLLKTGDLYGADFCYHVVPETLDIFDKKSFFENPTEFYIVCTDIESGEAYYKKIEKPEPNLMDWFRASASLPLVSRVVEIEGRKFLDGGVTDSVPLKYFQQIGYDKNIVILTQPKDYVKKKNSLMGLARMMLKDYPKLISAMERRHEMYNETIEYIKQQEKAGTVYVIRPEEKLPIKRAEKNPDKLKAVYELGRAAGEKHLANIKKFIR